MRDITQIIIHCSATKPSMDIGAKKIRNWHTKGNGWADIGYHFVIRRDGTIETGRPIEKAGAHTSGHNANSIGVCLVGGVAGDGKTPENNFTSEQWATLQSTIHDLSRQFPKAYIHGHNEFAAKACPCFDVQEWLASLGGEP